MLDQLNIDGKYELKLKLTEQLSRKSVEYTDSPRHYNKGYVDSDNDSLVGRRNSNLSYISDGNPIQDEE